MAKKRTQIINNASALEIRQNAARAIYEETVSNSIQNDAWLSQQPAALQKFLGGNTANGEYTLGVAMFNREMGNVISRSSHVSAALEFFSPYNVERTKSPFEHNAVIDKVYGELGRKDSNGNSHIQTLIGGKGTNISLQWENMPGYQSHQTAKQAMEAIQNAKQHGVVAWDLETTAGKVLGSQNYAANITEFSFARKNNAGKMDRWQSIIGATQKEFDEYMDVVQKFRYGAKDLSHEELVTGQRLALMGNAKTSVKFENGVFNYASFAGGEDVRNLDWADMEAGARELFRIGEEQRAAGLIQGYGGHRMYAWENQLLGGIGAIMRDGATALGYNSRTFDMNRLNQLVSSGKLSSGAMQALRDIGYDGTLSFKNHLDIMPIMREKFSKDSYTAEDYRYMQQHGLTEFQQETLVRKLTSTTGNLGGEDFYQGKPAHMAMTDVEALIELADKSVLSNDSKVASQYMYNSSDAMAIEGGKGQLFMAKQRINADRYNLMVAMEDELTGQLRMGDKYAIGQGGEVEEQLFGQSGLQRGVTYEIESLSEKKMSNEFKSIMGELYPQMALDNLTVMKVKAFAPGANTVRSQSYMYYIGYKDDIEHAMMDNTLYVGNKDANGNVDPSKVSERTKKELAMFTQAGQGPSSVVVDSQADVNQAIERGGKIAQEDAAARVTRYKSYNHDAKLIHLMEAIQEQVDQSAGTKTWSAVENEFWNNSVRISNALVSGQKIDTSSAEFVNSFNNYLGFANQKTGVQGILYSETLSSQRARLGWAQQNYDVIKAALNKVEPIGDPNQRKFAYQQIMQGIEDYAIANGGYGNIGYQASPAFGYEYTNRFDVNLRGFKGITENKVITINMDSYGSTVANQVIRAANLGTVDEFNDSSKSKLLNDLQQFMRKNGYLGKQTQNFVEHGDSLALAGNKFLASLVDARAQNADIGHLIDPETGFMRGMSRITLNTPKNFGIQKDINSLINEIASNLPRYHVTFGTDPNKIKENAKTTADMVSDMLFQQENVAELKKAGYTDKEISTLSEIRRITRGDTKEYLSSLFESIGSLGGTVHWDDKTRRVSATLQGQSFNLELPTGVFRGGQYQTKIGRSIVSVPLGIYDMRRFGENKANLQYASLIKKAVSENQGLLRWHTRQAQKDGQSFTHIQKFISDFNQTIRQSPVAKELGETQRANQFLFDYWDLFENVDSIGLTDEDFKLMDERAGRTPIMDEAGKITGYSDKPKTNVELVKRLARGEIHLTENGRPKMEYMNALMENIDIIFDRFENKFSNNGMRDMIKNLRFDTKMADRLRAYATSVGDPFLEYGHTKRGPYSIEDSARINMSRVKDMIKAGGPDYDALKGIEAGAGLTSESRAKWAQYNEGFVDAQGKELEYNTRVRANVIHMNRGGLAATMNYGMQQLLDKGEKIDASVQSLIGSMMAEEGAGFMHGQVFDRIMNARYSTQKIALDKLVQSGGQTLNDIRQKYHSIPKFEFKMNANGSFDINFKYDTGMFVMRDDVIASVEGQGTRPSQIAAKYDGIFNFGFFDAENQLISEEQINNILRKDQNFLSRLNATAESQRAQAVMNYLENERGFASSFFVQTSAANPLVKVAEFSEKGMTRGLIAGTGELNHDIRAVMETLGFSGSNLSFTDSNGRRRTLQSIGALEIDVIDSLKSGGNLLDTKFGVEAKGRYERITGTELTEAELRKILSDNNFGSAESFRKAIMEERYTPSRVVSKIFGDMGITSGDEAWHFITNHYANVKKHGDLTSYRYLTDEWIKREGLEGAKKNVAKYLLGVNESDADKYIGSKNNSLFLRDGVKLGNLNYGNLKEIYKQTGIIKDGQYTTQMSRQFLLGDQLMKVGIEKLYGELSQVGHYWDRDKVSDNAVRFNQRAITMAENLKYSDEVIENARKFLEGRGDDGKDIYEKYLANAERGAVVNQGAVDQIKRNVFNRATSGIGSEKIMGYMDIDGSGELKVGIDKAALGRMIREEHIAGGDVKQGTEILTHLMKNANKTMGITTINREGAVNLYRATMATAAEAFQSGQMSLEGMKKLGFKVKSIDDLMFGDTGPDSIFGENVLVDLNTKIGSLGDKLYDGDNDRRYLALSYNPGQQDADVFSAPQKQVEGIVKELQQYEGNLSTAGFRSDEERAHGLEKVMNKVQGARDAIHNAFTSKNGIMANVMRAHMHDGSRNTARGIDILGIENLENKNVNLDDLVSQYGSRLDALEINGHKLVEEAARGKNALQFSYTILSKERMQDIYNKNYGELEDLLKKQGVDTSFLDSVKQSTFEEVMTKGTHGISAREPLQYFGSITQRQIFFSEIAKENEAIGNFTSAIMRKEDYDSDAVVNAIHKEQAAISFNGSKTVNIEVDSAMYNVLSRTNGVSIKLLDSGAQERFESYTASQYYLGAGEAQRYRQLIDWSKEQKAGNLLEPYDEKTRGKHDITSIGGTSTAFAKQGTMDEYRDLRKKYSEVSAKLFNRSNDFFQISGEERRLRMVEYHDELLQAGKKDEAKEVKKAVQFSIIDKTLKADLTSRTAQPYGAGIVNHYTQTYLNIANEVLGDADVRKAMRERGGRFADVGKLSTQIALTTTALQEGYLSPKNNTSEVSTKALTDIFNEAFRLSDNASEAERKDLKDRMFKTVWGVVGERLDKEMAAAPSDQVVRKEIAKNLKGTTYTEEQLRNYAEEATHNYVDFLVDDVQNRGNSTAVFGMAAKNPTQFKNLRIGYAPESSRFNDQYLGVINNSLLDMGADSTIDKRPTYTGMKDTTPIVDDAVSDMQEQSQRIARAKGMQKSMTEAAQEALGKLGKGHGLFGAAVGIAGGLMVAGFVNDPSGGQHKRPPTAEGAAFGNTPMPNASQPEPALTQAQDGYSYVSANAMPLTDSNLNVLRGGPKSSYVINISGNSPQGQQAAVNAIQNSIGGNVPQNSSINVAINNNMQDTLSQWQVNRMVQTAVGF